MGAGASQFTGSRITRQQLLTSTQTSRDFMNKLFQAMLKDLTPEDFMKLGKTQTCSSFVFLMADSIDKLFLDLRIRPSKDKRSGVVYFQKIDELKKQTKDSKELCLVIAYFYIRIFQIFGALALSILDDPSAGAVLGVLKYQAPVGRPQGLFARQPIHIPGRKVVMVGGALDTSFDTVEQRKYRYLKDILEDPTSFSLPGGRARKAFVFSSQSDLILIPERLEQNLVFKIGNETYVLAKFEFPLAVKDGIYTSNIILKGFAVLDTSLDAEMLKKVNMFMRSIKPSTFKINSVDKSTWALTDGTSLEDKLVQELQKVARLKDEFVSNPERAVAKRGLVPGAILPGARPGVAAGDAFVKKPLQTEYIIQAIKGMAGYKTTSFCVARALQLLDAQSQYTPRPTDATSYVCMPKFDALPTAVPEAGRAVTSIPGLRALDSLYYMNPHLGPSDEVVLAKAEPDYAQFLTAIQGLFGKEAGTTKLTDLDSVIARSPTACADAAKHYLKIQDPAAIQRIQGVVGQLFGRQLEHTKKVISFFQTTLFLIKKGRDPTTGATGSYIEIHPRLLQGGIDELAKVSKVARELLIDYYKGCESLYQKGIQEVLASKKVVI